MNVMEVTDAIIAAAESASDVRRRMGAAALEADTSDGAGQAAWRATVASRLPGRIVDYGCGWGELMLRIAEAVPDAQATGVDIFGPDILRGREAAAERGLAHRVTFIEGPAAEHTTPADLVLNSGSYQAFVRVKPHEDGAVVCLKSSLKPVTLRPGLAYAFRHGNAGWEDFVLAETHPAGR